MGDSSKIDRLIAFAKDGPFRARDLGDLGIPRSYLTRLVDRGALERTSRGVYRLADAQITELHSLGQVALHAPHVVICLLSALQAHELTTEVPAAVWIMIAHKAWAPTLDSLQVEVVRASGAALDYGVEELTIEGVSVKMTQPAKTVADCFRYRRHVGLDVALEALRDYLKRSDASIDALVEAARADRVLSVMRPYLEALA
ncbi:MAG: type IV toxin-antitoxin system AbiEi family antitoxin domain-containing protein [Myxococcota bacterium]